MYTTLGTKFIQLVYNLYTRFIQLVSKNNIAILSWFSAISVVLSLCIQLVYSHKTVTVVQPQNNVGDKIYTTCIQLVYNLYTTFIQFEPESKVRQIYEQHVRFADML